MAMTNSEEAVRTDRQRTTPCHDCPLSRKPLKGWLGGATALEYRSLLHSDQMIDCHTEIGRQCAGAAIYRTNVAKSAVFRLPRDTKAVFGTPAEFVTHHEKIGL